MVEELARVLDLYALGELRSAQRIDGGHVDENWIVETDRGRYFLKRRAPRRRQPPRLVRAQHTLIEHLRQAGFPAPYLVPTVTGETFAVEGDDLYELREYIGGEPYDHDRPEHLDAAARMLGHYDTCVEGFAPPALRERKRLYGPLNARQRLDRLRGAWRLDRDAELVGITWQLEAQVEDVRARFARHGVLPHLVNHGDYYAGNLLFDGDRIVGLVDYDKANWGPRVAELAEALIYFASPRPGYLKHLVYPGVLEWEPFARFLHGYAQIVTLHEAEIRALPDTIGCIWFWVSLWRLLERYPCRPAGAAEALQEVLTLTQWAWAHDDRMVELARSAMNEEMI